MLQAALFDEFKGTKTLLLWGDKVGMTVLLNGVSRLRNHQTQEFLLGEGKATLTICPMAAPTSRSHLAKDKETLRWECSPETLELAEGLIEPLLDGPGHQYIDVSGLAEQVMISRDEYPADLR